MIPERDDLVAITGTVQGVGFRPFVARLASRLDLRGWVRNDQRGVAIRVAGPSAAVAAFVRALDAEHPPAARISTLRQTPAAEAAGLDPIPAEGFLILASQTDDPSATAAVTPDLALCPDCRRELADPRDRRHHYPFINCTNCGPRYSILRELPYDRPRTTMAAFTMCPACRREYEDPADRRYHAEPNACPVCGPHVELQDRSGRVLAVRDTAITAAAEALKQGRIVAVKGLGGFHLMVDAGDEAAVSDLRQRKHREEKPLAVMFPSLAALESAALLDDQDRHLLTSAAAPIVLVRRRAGAALAGDVAPGNPWVGALLPYTPLHALLMEAVGRPVVATSGNLSEEPLCVDNTDARRRLGEIADLFLMHNRGIFRPVDDSVIRQAETGPVLLRRARGFAPTPLALPEGVTAKDSILCVGGHLKNTVAVTAGDRVVLSPHIGDLSNPASIDAFRQAVELLGSLYPGRFVRVACDAHPDYASTRFAREMGVPTVPVQHHLAHILSCLLENGGGPDRVLGVAWDGTGYGPDGTIWGGEFIAIGRKEKTARRVAHLRPFRLPGGEAAIREPRRSALGLLHDLYTGDRTLLAPAARRLGFRDSETDVLSSMLDRGLHAPFTTSAGRLFDGMAALLNLCLRSSFEGQAAMTVEFAAEPTSTKEASLILPITAAGPGQWEIDWRPIVAASVETGTSFPSAIAAARFHQALARSAVDIARAVGIATVALSGGCFQNTRLLDAIHRELTAAGFNVLCHRALPPNDGGLSAGQALAALWGITSVSI